ncbi:MAG: TetR/AcrR family transcriptional regulator [Gammaproteobacteria bacterium]|nr:TetR/AcrR family transcriptional regulator [Gammaproteobacteria bacterium]NIR84937.1 TetR/AcrR family transcriptional regulator [Gammaproteobacteria bacterium]NIR91786.1 TetR/AcrR family transcriptional regulator [Gammaproteobacteria bacterium]NIU05984.1 TetR/AcrR family transcriptional regulator [Gammaproteobacteria bacterium]NIV53031.1 TetR family transcriptional regulator [Gammaproteobacteria bacterium]
MTPHTNSPEPRASTKEGAIVEAATRTFLRCGYGGASMDAIAQEAGVSKQTIYNNFGSKEALFGAIVRDLCDQLLTPLLTPETKSQGLEAALTSLARQYLDLMLAPDSLALYRVLMAEVTRFPELGRVTYEAGPAPAVQSLARFLGEQSNAGQVQVDDPELAAEQFYGMLHGYLQLRALLGVEQAWAREELEHYLKCAVDTFLAAHRP